jgi:hypothetical protein
MDDRNYESVAQPLSADRLLRGSPNCVQFQKHLTLFPSNRGYPMAQTASPQAPRRAWERPMVTDLPRLTELTLATGPAIPGGGGPGGGGSTVIP